MDFRLLAQTRPSFSFLRNAGSRTIGIMKIGLTLGWLLGLAAGGLALAQEPPTPSGGPATPDHRRTDWFPATTPTGLPGIIQTPADWEQRRTAILLGFQKVTGPLPPREPLPDPEIQITETVETDAYTRQTLSFVSEPGDRCTAYLYVPKNIPAGERRPGIVALHPTGELGKGIVDGQSERPHRAYARELAERGNVVIAPDYVSFGGLKDYDFAADRHQSGTIKGIWNHLRAVDLLVARPDVDAQRIAAIGHSLGGHNAIFLGVFDPRVKVIVSSCGWTPFHDYYGGKLKGWTSDRYMPAIRDEYHENPDEVPFDLTELVAALAPRAFYSNSPLRDANFDYRGIEKAAPEARRIYQLLGVPDKLRITYPDCEHDFPDAVREEAYEFIDKAWRAE